MHDKNAYNNGERNMEKKKDMLEQHLAENFIELAKEEEQQINHIKIMDPKMTSVCRKALKKLSVQSWMMR